MVYKEIIRIFDERRRKLEGLLSEDVVQLSHERIHQIKGAVEEIDLFLLTLRQHQDQRVHRNFDYKAKLRSEKKGFFSKVLKPSTRQFAMNEAVR